jgi:electron transfer flavoprotein alpha subunit
MQAALLRNLLLRRFSSGSSRASLLIVNVKEDGKLNSSLGNLVSAALYLNPKFTLLLSGKGITGQQDSAIKQLKTFVNSSMIDKVLLHEEDEGGISESLAFLAPKLSKEFSHFLTLHDSFGKDCLPRMAGRIGDGLLVPDALAIEKEKTGGSDKLTFTRFIYAGNAIARVESRVGEDGKHFISIRPTAFPTYNVEAEDSQEPIKVEILPSSQSIKSKLISRSFAKSARPELGAAAKIVVSGGRALKSTENFEKIMYPLADALGAAVGASRAAVDAGYVGNDLQVGQTGKIVAPQLYIAIGISGAIQHVAGMKDSKVIVAINKDPECPITQVADYSLIGDLFQLVPELTQKLKSE